MYNTQHAQQALEQIKKVAEYIEQKSADSEKVHKMISIQSRFHGECEVCSPLSSNASLFGFLRSSHFLSGPPTHATELD